MPESLHERQSTNRRNNKAGSFQENNKPLNDDIHIEKKAKKAKSKKPHNKNAALRHSYMLEGIGPSIAVYSPAIVPRRSANGNSGVRLSAIGHRHSKIRHSHAAGISGKQKH